MLSKNALSSFWVLIVIMTASPVCHASLKAPELMAPAGEAATTRVADRCPTFHWSPSIGARGYELVVYRADGDTPEEHYRVRLPPGSSWTPALTHCLEPGGRYAWSVGAMGDSGAAQYSEIGLFEVASQPSREEIENALALLQRYLAQEEESDARGPSQETSPEEPTVEGTAPVGIAVQSDDLLESPPAALTSPTQLVVDGAIEGEDFVYGTPRLRDQAVPAAVFRTNNPNVEVFYALGYSYITNPTTSYSAIAPIHLPEGSRIELVTCYAYDNDADNSGQWQVSFRRRQYTNNGLTQVTSLIVDTMGASTTVVSATFGPFNATVNNTSNMEFLQLDYTRDFGSANTPELRFYGCKVTYEVTRVDTP